MRVRARPSAGVDGNAVAHGQECLDVFRSFLAVGEIRGTPCIRSHVSVHRATTKYFPNSLISKMETKKEGCASPKFYAH
jgi:hypothetical protein